MEKLRKLTQMTEHPEQYSDEEWQEIFGGETVSDEQVETEWKRFEQQHFPRHNRQWLKMAASFIGILSQVYFLVIPLDYCSIVYRILHVGSTDSILVGVGCILGGGVCVVLDLIDSCY